MGMRTCTLFFETECLLETCQSLTHCLKEEKKLKTRPVNTIAVMDVRELKENDGGVNSSMIYCKNFCKCHI
jgi:hypothetical protein